MDYTSKPFKVIAHISLILVCIAVIIPLLLMVSSSLTSEAYLNVYGFTLLPRDINFLAYKYLFTGGNIFTAYGVTLFVTVVGTVVGLTLTVLLAYMLSIKDIPFRKFFSFLVFFTMLFNGGLVATYLMYTNVFHIKNTIWALIVPGQMINAFLVIITRSYMQNSIPGEVKEAAQIDGAGEVRVLIQVVIPMSVPILATAGLMIGLGYWNNWTNGLYYITKPKLYSVQQLLNQMMVSGQALNELSQYGSDAMQSLPTTAMKMATAVIGILPIMVVYPFFQRFFVKGISLGAVKG